MKAVILGGRVSSL